MIASSSTVLSNLAYLIGAIVVAVIAGMALWLHHRQPKSADASMASFRRGLSALAPDSPPRKPTVDVRPRPVTALTHVKVEVEAGAGDASGGPADGDPG